ncbi:MAG: transcription-repair coupling factor [Burkholderiales bacterium]
MQHPVSFQGFRTRHSCPHGSSDAYTLGQIARENDARLLVAFTANAAEAQRLLEETAWFESKLKLNYFPDWETLPYDLLSPHHDLVSERLGTLYTVMNGGCEVLIVPVTTTLTRLPPVRYLAAHTFFLRQKQKLDSAALRQQLTLAGYTHVTQVLSPGEYSFRGGLIDLFPMGSALPFRIDLFGDEIETLRTFDVDTQRSLYPVGEIRLLPAREFPLDEDGRTLFRQRYRDEFEGDPSRSTLYKSVSNGVAPAGIEYYLPLFFDETATLFDYLPQNTTLVFHDGVQSAIDQFWRDTRSRHDLLKGNRAHPVLPPEHLFLTSEQFFAQAKKNSRIDLTRPSTSLRAGGEDPDCATAALPSIPVERRADDPLAKLRAFIGDFDGRILLLAGSPGRRETMLEYFHEYGLKPEIANTFGEFLASAASLMLGVSPLHGGFVLLDPKLALITESELYSTPVRHGARRAATSAMENWLRDLSEVQIGDAVVHQQHGIGHYLGLANFNLGEGETEFLALEYEDAAKLYVPVSQLHLISRYAGAEGVALSRLGGAEWDRAKRRAAQQVRDTAAELLHLYSQRAARGGHAFEFNSHDYEAFAEGFGFEETADQATAIEAVLNDMREGRAMDRLICGDVGFGKTEVALRAAFAAIAGGRQVALLAPTTLLVEQHYQVFSDRFSTWPVRIAELSRFRSEREQATILAQLAEGKIDLVIGTHKLIQKGVAFKNLGLVIIDEEHRFGVRQKEQLKALRAEVDVLTLTATPIPRTLAMALEGLRDFSVIATAPERRLAIKTFVSIQSDALIREAILRELKRGGQVYFLHNDISTINAKHDKLARLVPEASIRVAHGSTPKRELERVMRDFYQQRFNVLVCTTIIETGIDVPTANTIIIEHADKFGLAQLHQLRGRVGRSHHQAYAYLLTPEEEALNARARKRLDAIKNMEELGAGFYLAMHDLEIRGAGEVLGEAQSGEINEIGFNLYVDMLEAAVKALKQGKTPDLSQPLGIVTEINLHTPALLPEDYCPDIHERLLLYKRLAHASSLEDLESIFEELVDRFGPLPPAAKTLVETHRLRVLSQPFGIARIDASAEKIDLHFVPEPAIDGARIIQLVQTRKDFRLAGPNRLRVESKSSEASARAANVKRVLNELTSMAIH